MLVERRKTKTDIISCSFYEVLDPSEQDSNCVKQIFGYGGLLDFAHEAHKAFKVRGGSIFKHARRHIFIRSGYCSIQSRSFWNDEYLTDK